MGWLYNYLRRILFYFVISIRISKEIGGTDQKQKKSCGISIDDSLQTTDRKVYETIRILLYTLTHPEFLCNRTKDITRR